MWGIFVEHIKLEVCAKFQVNISSYVSVSIMVAPPATFSPNTSVTNKYVYDQTANHNNPFQNYCV